LAALLSLAGPLAIPAPALGQAELPDAKALADKAEKDALAHRYDAAVDGYRQVYEITREPAYLYNIALIYLARMNDPLRAWQYGVKYEAAAKTDSDRADAAALIQKAEEALGKTHGKLAIAATPPTADLWVDRKAADTKVAGSTTWVRAGEHTVFAAAPGYEDGEAKAAVRAGSRTEVTLALRAATGVIRVECGSVACTVFVDGALIGPAPVEQKVAAGPHKVRAVAEGHVPFEDVKTADAGGSIVIQAELVPIAGKARKVEPLPAGGPKGGSLRTWAYVSWGGAAALAIGGTVCYFLARKDFNKAGGLDPDDFGNYSRFSNEFDSLVSSGRSKGYAAYGLWGVAGAAAIAGTVLFFLPDSKGAPAFVPAGPGGPGATAAFRW
jgi:hypothetical protein